MALHWQLNQGHQVDCSLVRCGFTFNFREPFLSKHSQKSVHLQLEIKLIHHLN